MDAQRRQLRLAVFVLCLILAVAISIQIWLQRQMSLPGQSVAPGAAITGTADVGGPFQLTDHTGRVVTDQDFRGRAMIIYFGWRLDPDLTPAALQVLSAALDRLGPKNEKLVPIFISIDAERDNPQNLHAFVSKIDRRLSALSGSGASIAALARAYKLYFKQLPDDSLPRGYSFDHASLYYVIGPDGKFLGVVPHTTDSAALSQELLKLVQ